VKAAGRTKQSRGRVGPEFGKRREDNV